jgi:endonuclease/exonuclease/phosphatase family metal-dependent hydrolase
MFHGKLDRNTALGLKELRRRIDAAGIPPSTLDQSLNLATWNIREFGKKPRLPASLHYIAEVMNAFDLIAVVEVRDDLSDLSQVLQYLGPYWHVVFSDYIADAGGNHERIAYVYDKRMVAFTGLAAEADAPRRKDPKTGEYLPTLSWWRSPYIASFRAGDFDFILIAAHIRWDAKGGAAARLGPLKLLAEWVDRRGKEHYVVDKDILVMGDFNIPAVDDPMYAAITSKGLKMPTALLGVHGSNLAKDKRYDQILHDPRYSDCFTNNGGALDFYTGGIPALYPGTTLTKSAFTYQMSDHLPLWVQVRTDTDAERIDQFIRG